MTNRQLIQFLKSRAVKNGTSLNLNDPSIVVYRLANKFFLAVKYTSYYEPFIVRFSSGDSRAPFVIASKAFPGGQWYDNMASTVKPGNYVDYNIDYVPNDIQAKVRNIVVSALKSPGMGLDCFAMSFTKGDPTIIDENESYEEAMIETDLMTGLDFFSIPPL